MSKPRRKGNNRPRFKPLKPLITYVEARQLELAKQSLELASQHLQAATKSLTPAPKSAASVIGSAIRHCQTRCGMLVSEFWHLQRMVTSLLTAGEAITPNIRRRLHKRRSTAKLPSPAQRHANISRVLSTLPAKLVPGSDEFDRQSALVLEKFDRHLTIMEQLKEKHPELNEGQISRAAFRQVHQELRQQQEASRSSPQTSAGRE